jgi:hypothetical protein
MSTLFEACVAGSGLLKQQSSRQLCLTVAEIPMQTGCWRLVFYFFSRQCRGARHVAQQFILCFSFLWFATEVDYTIKVSSASVAAATSLGDQIKGKVKAVPLAELGAQILKNVAAVSTSGTTYTITVTGVTAEAVVEVLVVTNTTSMKQVDGNSGSIRVARSSSFAAGYCSFFTCGRSYCYPTVPCFLLAWVICAEQH